MYIYWRNAKLHDFLPLPGLANEWERMSVP